MLAGHLQRSDTASRRAARRVPVKAQMILSGIAQTAPECIVSAEFAHEQAYSGLCPAPGQEKWRENSIIRFFTCHFPRIASAILRASALIRTKTLSGRVRTALGSKGSLSNGFRFASDNRSPGAWTVICAARRACAERGMAVLEISTRGVARGEDAMLCSRWSK